MLFAAGIAIDMTPVGVQLGVCLSSLNGTPAVTICVPEDSLTLVIHFLV